MISRESAISFIKEVEKFDFTTVTDLTDAELTQDQIDCLKSIKLTNLKFSPPYDKSNGIHEVKVFDLYDGTDESKRITISNREATNCELRGQFLKSQLEEMQGHAETVFDAIDKIAKKLAVPLKYHAVWPYPVSEELLPDWKAGLSYIRCHWEYKDNLREADDPRVLEAFRGFFKTFNKIEQGISELGDYAKLLQYMESFDWAISHYQHGLISLADFVEHCRNNINDMNNALTANKTCMAWLHDALNALTYFLSIIARVVIFLVTCGTCDGSRFFKANTEKYDSKKLAADLKDLEANLYTPSSA
ncbi:MAG: hypothetical protein A3F18_07595 [Legionellales bacterium RIFCSPHIGHO2_12_FULL_37_14]|nr:MAG: hypothetical protein A3F18_07595 [Legionellales bacterium RIFCSPHIGHO2_12_FULL_37_14]